MPSNPKVKIKREHLMRLLDGDRVHLPSSVGLLEAYVVDDAPWAPLRKLDPTPPHMVRAHKKLGLESDIEVWANEIYEVIVVRTEDFTHLSIKRYDRAPIRNWRHFQQMKNEICGDDAEGVELYPAERRIADNANQYHLWVAAPGMEIPMGFTDGMLTSDDQVKDFNDAPHPGRQEPWQEGLTTGEARHEPERQAPEDDRLREFLPGSAS